MMLYPTNATFTFNTRAILSIISKYILYMKLDLKGLILYRHKHMGNITAVSFSKVDPKKSDLKG